MNLFISFTVTVACLAAASSSQAQGLSFCQIMNPPSPLSRVILLQSVSGPDCNFREVLDYVDMHSPAPKDEFETTANYNTRLQSSPPRTPSGGSLNQDYAVVIHVNEDAIIYNADQERLSFTEPGLSGSRYLDRSTGAFIFVGVKDKKIEVSMAIVVDSKVVNDRFQAHDTIGQQLNIEKQIGDCWALKVPSHSGPSPTQHGLSMKAEVAKSVKGIIYVVLIGSSPLSPTGRYLSDVYPNTNFAFATKINVHYIQFTPRYAFIVRGDNGEVLQHLQYDADGAETVVPIGVGASPPLRQVIPAPRTVY